MHDGSLHNKPGEMAVHVSLTFQSKLEFAEGFQLHSKGDQKILTCQNQCCRCPRMAQMGSLPLHDTLPLSSLLTVWMSSRKLKSEASRKIQAARSVDITLYLKIYIYIK